MAPADNIVLAMEFLRRLGTDAKPDAVVELFADDACWDVPGDASAFPWIGKHHGTQAVRTLLTEMAAQLERIRLDIDDILASDTRAVIVGQLASRVKPTGRMMTTGFVIILTIADGRITRFQMLEDSFAVSQAAHAEEH